MRGRLAGELRRARYWPDKETIERDDGGQAGEGLGRGREEGATNAEPDVGTA